MGMIHKKSRTTGKRPRRTGEKVAQNTGTDFLALRLGVVLSLPSLEGKLFGDFFGILGPETPVNGRSGLKTHSHTHSYLLNRFSLRVFWL